jgi:hypothetical protein
LQLLVFLGCFSFGSPADEHPSAGLNAIGLCNSVWKRRIASAKPFAVPPAGQVGGKMMNRGHLVYGDMDQLGSNIRTLVDRNIRERLQNERQLAERRMTKHRLDARKSCTPDITSYRIALRQFKRWLRGIAH